MTAPAPAEAPRAKRSALLRWGGPCVLVAVVAALEAWGYARAVATGRASPPPRLFETILAPFGLAPGADGVFLDMFALAFAVNLLVFAWCRRKVEAQKAKIAALAKTTLTPEERETLHRMIVERMKKSVRKTSRASRSASRISPPASRQGPPS